ncbi:hypothetical protein NEOLEDRAFT_1183562 [Neolentinus lepideus HHB14362 ss-1]|uniref:Uncharacterized protein n=1 Tax=Neolentinus lepideus HHB14362 ss-1 TaxID=1314782 RepID=A0A165N6S4_9AGAM|nr:hypothetical protein NEOLEDRAFT_1183562 [Neolentinus lepideus HHB14362 ss-1]
MANTHYPMPTAIIHGGNNFPKTISECRKIIKDLEEVNYVQFTMVENLRLDLDEAQEDLRKAKASIHQCHKCYRHNTQHNDRHCRESEREYEHRGERKRYREPESPFVEIECLAKHSSSSFRPMDISEDRYKRPTTTSSEDQSVKLPEQSDSTSPAGWGGPGMGWGTESVITHRTDSTAVPSQASQSKGGGELKEQAEEPPTITAPMTEPMIMMASFVDTPTNEVFLKLIEKCPELAPRGFQKGSVTTLKVRARWWRFLHHAGRKLENTDAFINFILHIIASGRYKAAIDNEEVMKATHRSSPEFTGDPTDEAHVLKYLAECGTWTAGLSYDSAVELGELRGVRHTPTQDPFTD